MSFKSTKFVKWPPLGMRIIKSSFGVFLAFVMYYLRGKQGAPFYTALSVLWCMRAYTDEVKSMAWQRTIGTFIGGFYGLLMIMIEKNTFIDYTEFLRYVLISLLIIPLIYTTVLINKKNASYFACVVFLSIVVLHLTDENPYIFVFNRVLDTLIGIGIALVLNVAELPKKKRRDVLFISGLDNVLLTMDETLTPYSKVVLNKMLDDGAQFTVSTMKTPAVIVEKLRDIRIKLPVIAMDGAVLFDIENKRYLKKFELEYEDAVKIAEFIENEQIQVFKNVVIEDMWAIYYGDFKNTAEENIFTKFRKSPYRNYIKSPLPTDSKVVYFMVIEKEAVVQQLYGKLMEQSWAHKLKMITYPSDDYPGYTYLKIYNKQATRENMKQVLCDMLGVEKVVTFGNIPGKSDVVVRGNDSDEVVKKLKKMYEYI